MKTICVTWICTQVNPLCWHLNDLLLCLHWKIEFHINFYFLIWQIESQMMHKAIAWKFLCYVLVLTWNIKASLPHSWSECQMPDLVVFPPPAFLSSNYRPIILWRPLSFSYTESLVESMIKILAVGVCVDQFAYDFVPYVSNYTVDSFCWWIY
jgi:hypothetical protein